MKILSSDVWCEKESTPALRATLPKRGAFLSPPRRELCTLRHLAHFTRGCSRASPLSSGRPLDCSKRPRRGGGGLPSWEGSHPGRYAGWKPALLKEKRAVLHSSVVRCYAKSGWVKPFYVFSSGTSPIKSITTLQPGIGSGPGIRTVVLAGGSVGKASAHAAKDVKNSPKSV